MYQNIRVTQCTHPVYEDWNFVEMRSYQYLHHFLHFDNFSQTFAKKNVTLQKIRLNRCQVAEFLNPFLKEKGIFLADPN